MALFALFDVESRLDLRLLRQCRYPTLPDTPEGHRQAFEFEAATLRDRQGILPSETPWFSLQWHVPISIAVGIVDPDDWALSNVETVLAEELPSPERERDIVAEFWRRAEAFRGRKGVLVAFNSRGFDLPLLELHALKHGIPTALHLSDKYGARYRFSPDSHLDLMDFLSNYGAVRPPKGGLGFLLEFLGYQGKGATSGADVQTLYEAGKMEQIEAYNRNDVRRLYQLFLHVQAWRGQLDAMKAAELACSVKMEEEL
jgi:3'-5' exonuclease